MKLAILIPTLEGREHLLDRLMLQLNKQINGNKEVCILINKDAGQKKTGTKRNELVQSAIEIGAEYVAQFDDDDLPGKTYIQNQLAAANSGMDCGSLWGNIYFSGKRGNPFHHSIKYDHWFQNKYLYARCPNHLNCVKLSILKEFPFLDRNFGEDGIVSEQMAKAGVLKTEYTIEDVIYHYFTGVKNTDLEQQVIKYLCGNI